jgi:hypothetical protein
LPGYGCTQSKTTAKNCPFLSFGTLPYRAQCFAAYGNASLALQVFVMVTEAAFPETKGGISRGVAQPARLAKRNIKAAIFTLGPYLTTEPSLWPVASVLTLLQVVTS